MSKSTYDVRSLISARYNEYSDNEFIVKSGDVSKTYKHPNTSNAVAVIELFERLRAEPWLWDVTFKGVTDMDACSRLFGYAELIMNRAHGSRREHSSRTVRLLNGLSTCSDDQVFAALNACSPRTDNAAGNECFVVWDELVAEQIKRSTGNV